MTVLYILKYPYLIFHSITSVQRWQQLIIVKDWTSLFLGSLLCLSDFQAKEF